MANAYIVTATTTQVAIGPFRKVAIQVNAALTGTISVIDGTSGSTANEAIITNPGVGARFEYWDFVSGVRIVTSAICDINVMACGSYGPK